MDEFIQISTTTEKEQDAQRIARVLVEKRLAGCVQIVGPIQSTYWWKGNIEIAQEWLCIIKSSKDHFEDLERTLKEIHPYETPEILAVPVVSGSKEYLEWLRSELRA